MRELKISVSNMCRSLKEKMKSFNWKIAFKSCTSMLRLLIVRAEFFLKQFPVRTSLCFFLTSLLLQIFFNNQSTISLVVAALASIFIALKYRLDQASYHKALFEERFAIFKVIDDIRARGQTPEPQEI